MLGADTRESIAEPYSPIAPLLERPRAVRTDDGFKAFLPHSPNTAYWSTQAELRPIVWGL